MTPTVIYLRALLDLRLAKARADERGVSAVEWVVITAFLVGIAVALAAIIQSKITNKANGINL